VPTLFAKLGILGGTALILAMTLLNYYTVWLMSKAESRFRNEFFMITSLHDLTTIVFGDGIVILQQVVRIANDMLQLLLMALVLGTQFATEVDVEMKPLVKHLASANIARAMHVTPKLISTAFLFLIVVIFASMQISLRTQKTMQSIAYLVFAVATCLLAFHLKIQAKPTLLSDASSQILRPDLLTDPKFHALDFIALASITMNMFDGNQQTLLIKAEMKDRSSFGCIAFASQLLFGLMMIVVGFFVNEISGATNLFDCLKPRSNLTHILTCLLLFCCLVWFMLTSQDMHSSM
jgi:hypothetical protein